MYASQLKGGRGGSQGGWDKFDQIFSLMASLRSYPCDSQLHIIQSSDTLTLSCTHSHAVLVGGAVLFLALKKEKTSNNNEDNIEIVTLEDVIDDEDLSSWTQNKMRGFKRTGPASPSARSNPMNSPPKNSTPTGTGIPAAPSQTNNTNGSSTSSNTNPQTQQETDSRWSVGGRKQYCHYFVNQGRCNYEERTGEKCKFVHEQAPMCKSGLGCNRNKCMYAHPNIGGNRNMNNTIFLEQTRGPQQIMNPWQIINPWMNPSTFQHLQNPWSMPGNQTKQESLIS